MARMWRRIQSTRKLMRLTVAYGLTRSLRAQCSGMPLHLISVDYIFQFHYKVDSFLSLGSASHNIISTDHKEHFNFIFSHMLLQLNISLLDQSFLFHQKGVPSSPNLSLFNSSSMFFSRPNNFARLSIFCYCCKRSNLMKISKRMNPQRLTM